MISYTVHERPDPSADRIDRAEQLVFIKDGFSWLAMLAAPIWLLVHRLWWGLLGYLLLSGALQAVQAFSDLDEGAGLALFALNVLVGFEADSIRRWSLDRKGWRMLGTVSGRTADDCERRFFDGWLPSQPIIAPSGGNNAAPRRRWPIVGSLLGARA